MLGRYGAFFSTGRKQGGTTGVPLLLKEEQRQLKQSRTGNKAGLQSGVVLEAWENTWNVLLLH